MTDSPGWARRNRFVAWSGIVSVLIAVALLPMTLAAIADHRPGLALLAGIVCAAITVYGISMFELTTHRDNLEHHEKPHLLSDSWTPVPARKQGRRRDRR